MTNKNLPPHHNLYVGVAECIDSIFFSHRYADKAVEYTLKQHHKWGSADRAFVAETVYDLVRWKRWIEAGMNQPLNQKKIWDFIGAWFLLNGNELPFFNEFKHLKSNQILKNHRKNTTNPAVMHSVPDWLYNIGLQELGLPQWHQELEALNQLAPTVLRCNTEKISPLKLKEHLQQQHQIESELNPKYPSAIMLHNKVNVFKTDAFKNGWFEIQDASSQLVAPFLEVETSMRLVDACAGAGGKSLHLSNLMQNKGQIIALDIFEWKLKELKRRAKRNSAQNIQTKLIEGSKTIKRLHNTADRLLIDAPCSGIGVLKRNPDAKWKLQPEFLEKIKTEQEHILHNYAKILKVGGKMVYATCSILPSENQDQIQKFIQNNPNYQLLKENTILPSESGFDGFYMACLERLK